MSAQRVLYPAIALALVALTAGAASGAPGMVTVRIHQVSALDDLDPDVFGQGRADFYAVITLDSERFRTRVWNGRDDLLPGDEWTFSKWVSGDLVNISLRLYDDDDGWFDKDDHLDINPDKGIRDIHLSLDRRSGRIAGDVMGMRGQLLTVRGGGDDDKAEVQFTIE